MTNDYSTMILGLAEKSSEISSLSNKDLADVCKEILDSIRSRAGEWSVQDNWIAEELKLRGILPETWTGQNKEMPPHAENMASEMKFFMINMLTSFLDNCIRSLEYREGADNCDVPDLLKSSRTALKVQSGREKRTYTVHGSITDPFLPGHEFELWTESTTEQQECFKNQEKSVTVVLGAGNESTLSLIDTLQRCILHRETVLLKHHPLRPYLIGPYGILLEPLIRRGYIAQILDKGIPDTKKLLSNPLVGHVHMTGSLKTEVALIETLSQTRTHKSKQEIRDMVTSELGCVTPWILSAGVYDKKELMHVARMIVASKKNFGGAACLSAQAVIVSKEWNQKDQFREALTTELKRQSTFPCYYPGSKERKREIEEKYDRSIMVEAPLISGTGKSEEDQVVVLECGTPGELDYNSYGLLTEAFGPVLVLVELSSSSSSSSEKAFVENIAAPFVNDKSNIYGSLSCSLIVPASAKQDKVALDSTVASLEYGTVAVNTWSATGYLAMTKGCIWAGSPHDKTGQSGVGYIGNHYSLAKPVKTVVHGPALMTKPLFDIESKPPKIIFDALFTMSSAPSIPLGIASILRLIVVRIFAAVWTYIGQFSKSSLMSNA